MINRCCKTPPQMRTERGKACENKWKEEFKRKGARIIDLSQNFGADFVAKNPDGSVTIAEVKSGCSKLTPNQRNLQNRILSIKNDAMEHKVLLCDCNGKIVQD